MTDDNIGGVPLISLEDYRFVTDLEYINKVKDKYNLTTHEIVELLNIIRQGSKLMKVNKNNI